MSEHEIDIADMQCWIFRMAQTKWKKYLKPVLKYFKTTMCLDSSPNATTFSI